jgi:molecular chaperone HtpG
MDKFKEARDANEIIGRFGLGFYSAFMVAEKVEIQTRSYQEGAEPAYWTCDGSTQFEIRAGERSTRGTDVILHLNEESNEFLDSSRIRGILNKYCRFLPVPIRFGTRTESVPDGEDKEGKPQYKTVEVDDIINTVHPLWTRTPAELTEEDYLNFYRELYPMTEDPLFWIHLNVDHPFTLTGVLYFPKIKNDLELQRNKIKLFSRQVFITDEVKDIVPEFLLLLHGVIDSPDIPLNVSRSFLQSDSNVKKINGYISRKVADKLQELFQKDRTAFQEKWKDLGLFVKYGILSDEKFFERARSFTLLTNTQSAAFTLDEYQEKVKPLQTDKDGRQVWLYTQNPEAQHSFVEAAMQKGYDVLVMDSPIDLHFIQHLETKLEKTSMKRVDADIIDKLIETSEIPAHGLSEAEGTELKRIFQEAISNPAMNVELESLLSDQLPVIITREEWMRRMKEMSKMGGGMSFYGNLPETFKVSLNGNHPLLKKILEATPEEQGRLARQVYDLALLAQGMLKGADLTAFVSRSVNSI